MEPTTPISHWSKTWLEAGPRCFCFCFLFCTWHSSSLQWLYGLPPFPPTLLSPGQLGDWALEWGEKSCVICHWLLQFRSAVTPRSQAIDVPTLPKNDVICTRDHLLTDWGWLKILFSGRTASPFPHLPPLPTFRLGCVYLVTSCSLSVSIWFQLLTQASDHTVPVHNTWVEVHWQTLVSRLPLVSKVECLFTLDAL